jgi:hypothetical protein
MKEKECGRENHLNDLVVNIGLLGQSLEFLNFRCCKLFSGSSSFGVIHCNSNNLNEVRDEEDFLPVSMSAEYEWPPSQQTGLFEKR